MIKAVIFDLDGVLTRTDKLHTIAWSEACNSWNIPFSPSVGELLRGISRLDSAKIILEKAGCSIPEKEVKMFADLKNKIYVELLNDLNSSDLCDGVNETIEYLASKKMPMAIASSSRNAGKILNQLGIMNKFSVIIDGNMIQRSKPDPEVFAKAVNCLNLKSKECLVVEDADSGVKAAKLLGCYTAGIGNEAWTANPEYKLQNIGQLIKILD